MQALSIDIISDTVCPWCLIGKRKLDRALAMRPDVTPQITWRAYKLNPDIPPEGLDRRTFTAQKFGSEDQARAIYNRIAEAGLEEGISFRFDRIERAIDTVDSHRLILWANTAGCQDAVVEALFAAYFFQGRDISDPTILSEIAGDAGMDRDLVAQLLAGDRDREVVEAEMDSARRIGVRGVPCFIFDRRLGVSGAQDPDILVKAIDEAVGPAPAAS
ncbi:MAG: DsbA family oxidoreductase [Rhodothalassiaceae bacterium]